MCRVNDDNLQWLNDEETETWLNVWSFYVWLPTRLDAQLKRDHGISHYDYFAMARISMAEDGRLRMSELAAQSDMTLSHLSRVVTRLENQNWVRRVPDPADGRSTFAELTESGWDLIRAAAPGHVREVRRLFFDHLTPEESHQVGEAMKKIVVGLRPQKEQEGEKRGGGHGPERTSDP
ncbi:MarR family winged helix-turn-helix transcriptional regulator [Corynebacterium halotolerans]|uniref:MarR family winged helix-turn-helix transcriptional regulator n=1 Tax=Corynebacterium halotolerans TaxID=225326 RepID=UPI0005A7A42C|nr:MarR family transcriptional regulator [Corynebacterium halotolerans]